MCLNTYLYSGDKFGSRAILRMNLHKLKHNFLDVDITPSNRTDSRLTTSDRDRLRQYSENYFQVENFKFCQVGCDYGRAVIMPTNSY